MLITISELAKTATTSGRYQTFESENQTKKTLLAPDVLK